jgi:outer membrane receptor protein involved in Fe transport
MTLASLRRFLSAPLILLFFTTLATLVPAQSFRQFDGKVMDTNSAVISGASVTLIARDMADTQSSANDFISELGVVNSERVEVLRGPGSSLYGSDAIGGVVNLVTDTGGGGVSVLMMWFIN